MNYQGSAVTQTGNGNVLSPKYGHYRNTTIDAAFLWLKTQNAIVNLLEG